MELIRHVLSGGLAWITAGAVSLVGIIPQALSGADPSDWIREGGAFLLLACIVFWVMRVAEKKLSRIEQRLAYMTAAVILAHAGRFDDATVKDAVKMLDSHVKMGG